MSPVAEMKSREPLSNHMVNWPAKIASLLTWGSSTNGSVKFSIFTIINWIQMWGTFYKVISVWTKQDTEITRMSDKSCLEHLIQIVDLKKNIFICEQCLLCLLNQ